MKPITFSAVVDAVEYAHRPRLRQQSNYIKKAGAGFCAACGMAATCETTDTDAVNGRNGRRCDAPTNRLDSGCRRARAPGPAHSTWDTKWKQVLTCCCEREQGSGGRGGGGGTNGPPGVDRACRVDDKRVPHSNDNCGIAGGGRPRKDAASNMSMRDRHSSLRDSFRAESRPCKRTRM